MYICPCCHHAFKDADTVAKHSLQCWREHNPRHESKPAPYESSTKRQVNEEVFNFFASFRKD